MNPRDGFLPGTVRREPPEAPLDSLLEEMGVEPPREEEILRRLAPLRAELDLAGAIERDMKCDLARTEALRLLLKG